jgi:NAD(P)-dependent dehydrogenase (short-subunit alcohol dehydrogenase family)
MAVDYGKYNIRVNSILPGAIDSPMLRNLPAFKDNWDESVFETGIMKGIAKPIETAKAALFFCSDSANWVTGTILPVDGGRSAIE